MSSIHLLVLVHGMWGQPIHLAELDRIIRETKAEPSDDGARLHVLLASTNSNDATYDGIDWGAERVCAEISDALKTLESNGDKVTRFSITGYSLGGLISRYVIGILHQRRFFDNVKPINFNTIATPHIGLLKYHSFFSSLASSLGPMLLSRTGEQFYCVDKFSSSGRPLLEVMADPDKVFYQGLALFQHLRIYANAINDQTVPFATAAIEVHDPFVKHETSGIEIELDEQYKPIIKSYTVPKSPPPKPSKPFIFSPKWFRSRKPMLPPRFQFRFPLNILLYLSLPILVPIVISLIIFRLARAARSSQARIKVLEKDSSDGQRLIHMFANIERQVENAVADLIDDPGLKDSPKELKRDKSTQPYLKPIQYSIADSLNTLPFEKVFAYFPDVTNSHAVVVSRDVQRFEFHRLGEGAIRHWADHFVL